MAFENPPSERFAAHARGDSLVATTLTTAQRLRAIADGAGHPVYWVADRPGATLQLTRSHTGTVLIRYLPPGMRPSDRTSPALGVSTVPFLGALAHVRSLARSPGAQLYRLRDGGLAVTARSAPGLVSFAYPGSYVLGQIYDPAPARAMQLLTSGALRPIDAMPRRGS